MYMEVDMQLFFRKFLPTDKPTNQQMDIRILRKVTVPIITHCKK